MSITTDPRADGTRAGLLLADALDEALRTATELCSGRPLEVISVLEPVSRRDGLLALLTIHDLSLAPVDRLSGAERWQHHPAVAAIRGRIEERLVEEWARGESAGAEDEARSDPVGAMRRFARIDQIPPIYDWVAERATFEQLRSFLELEGGPDGGFDDLVAMCQVGLSGSPKVEMARNYWDEMGNGDGARVHTELHRDVARALGFRDLRRADLPDEALERSVLGGLLVLSRRFQPEAVGALGLLELQAGPRCRRVVAGLERVGAPAGAFPFYREHAEADPRHGKAWLEEVVADLGRDPRWAVGMARGARWRSTVNARFFRCCQDLFDVPLPPAPTHGWLLTASDCASHVVRARGGRFVTAHHG